MVKASRGSFSHSEEKHTIKVGPFFGDHSCVCLLCNNYHQFLSCTMDSSQFRLPSRAPCIVVTLVKGHKQGAGPGTTRSLLALPGAWGHIQVNFGPPNWRLSRRRWGKKIRESIQHHTWCLRACEVRGVLSCVGKAGPATATQELAEHSCHSHLPVLLRFPPSHTPKPL